MSLPILKGETCLVGWRGWKVIRPSMIYSSAGDTAQLWMPHERVEAFCPNGSHVEEVSPVESCSCGVYAFKEAVELKDQSCLHQTICGEVWLWGRVIEHTKGYKAQYAYPKRFWMLKSKMKHYGGEAELLYIAYKYGVELSIIEKWDSMIYTPEALVKMQRVAMEEEARRLRRLNMSKAEKAAETRVKNQMKMVALAKHPATKPGFKNMLEQFEAELREATK